MSFQHLLVSLILLAAVRPVAAQDAKEVDFARSVRPILVANCIKCHGAEKQRGGLRLDRGGKDLAESDSGPVVTPGKPAESLLLKKVMSKDPKERMPPGDRPLTDEEIRTLKAWIEAGARWPSDNGSTERHWAFEPVTRPPLPPHTAGNPIDRFIAGRLADNGQSLSPEADRRTLIRRLKLDLLGLPPTPEEVEEFIRDTTPNAYEKLVARYLASPHHGERWARHWLDVVRFAESNGFETNQPRKNAWHYRDWVIQSLNEDKPYDRFVREQLAGDTLGADAATGFIVGGAWDEVKSPDISLTLQQRADELHDMVSTTGSAFLGLTVGCARCHSHKFDPIPQLDYYRIKAVFAGVQHGERPLRGSASQTALAERQRLRSRLAEVEACLTALSPLADPAATEVRRPAVDPRRNIELFQPVRARFVRFVVFETTGLEPCIDEFEVFTTGPGSRNVAAAAAGGRARSAGDYAGAPGIHRLEFLIDGKYGNSRSWISNTPGRGRVEIELKDPVEIDRIVWGRDREARYTDRLPTRYRIDVSTDGRAWSVVASSDDRMPFASTGATVRVAPGLSPFTRFARRVLDARAEEVRARLMILESTPMAYAGRLGTPEPTHLLHRGDPLQKKQLVPPGVLTEIGPRFVIPENAAEPQRRDLLASWITDPANPLTARVIVNRLWQYHFGAGIVDTPSDFGRNGGKPTHPELLDWLAAELVSSGWSLKHIHRLIVTSATYRQSSAATSSGMAKDAQTRLLWRYPQRRMEAEPLRDSILFTSGKLDLRMGGPGFDLFQPNGNYVKVYTPKTEFGPAEFRRMVYQQKPRMQLDDTFGVFDCPDGGQIAPRRNISTTPLQALNLLNSTFILQQAAFFAERIAKEAGSDVPAQVRKAFALAFQRLPSDRERNAAESLVREHGLAALCRALLNANEFATID